MLLHRCLLSIEYFSPHSSACIQVEIRLPYISFSRYGSLFHSEIVFWSRFWAPAWIKGCHRAETLGDWTYSPCSLDSLSVIAPRGIDTLKPTSLDIIGVSAMEIPRMDPWYLSFFYCLIYIILIWCNSCCSPPQHAVRTQLRSVWELTWPIHYGAPIQSVPKLFSEKLFWKGVQSLTYP